MPASPTLNPIQGNWNFCGLNWSPYSGEADGFNVYRKLSNEQNYTLIVPWQYLSTTSTHSGGQSGLSYDHYVTAVKDGVESAPSNVRSFTYPPNPTE
jgi:fibronectin type 3 domain-containing protein